MQSLSISSSFQLCKSKTLLSFRAGKQLNSVMYQFVVGLCSDCCCAVVVEKLRCEVKCGVPTCYGGQSWVIQTAASPTCCNSQLQRLGVFPSASKREANKVSLKVYLQQPSIFDVRQQWTFATFNIGSVQSSSREDAGSRLQLRLNVCKHTTMNAPSHIVPGCQKTFQIFDAILQISQELWLTISVSVRDNFSS